MPVPAGGSGLVTDPDLLATVDDLKSMPGANDVTDQAALILLQCATAVVQAAAGGQRILQATSTAHLDGSVGHWLWLPQRPVISVESVSIDGEALTTGDWSLRGQRLYRQYGWWALCGLEPLVEVEHTHGYPEGSQDLQLARKATLMLAAGVASSGGVTREQLDDYSVAYEATAAAMETSPQLEKALLRQYGFPASLIKVG